MRARWSRLAGLALVAALVGGLLPAPLAARPARAAGQIRWGYYVTYAGDSLTSLRAHVDSLTHVSPFYYTLGAGGAIDLKEEQPETTRFLRSRGVAIVPMIKNSATYDAFHALLDTPEERDRLVADLVRLVETRDYDGIHIDFEGVNAADRPLLTDFMHRLHAQLRPRGKLTTMAVAAKARDATTGWAGAYDYAALAPALDLAVVMAYDFHWSSGPTPGPVAPVPWQRGVLAFAAAQFGADKTLLGLPFYGLDWNTTTGPPARSVRMADGPALLRKPGATGGYSAADEANWVQWTEDGEAHEAWYEDERSLTAKLALVADLGLAGFATWRLGHEDESAWVAIRRLDTPATRVPPCPTPPTAPTSPRPATPSPARSCATGRATAAWSNLACPAPRSSRSAAPTTAGSTACSTSSAPASSTTPSTPAPNTKSSSASSGATSTPSTRPPRPCRTPITSRRPATTSAAPSATTGSPTAASSSAACRSPKS